MYYSWIILITVPPSFPEKCFQIFSKFNFRFLHLHFLILLSCPEIKFSAFWKIDRRFGHTCFDINFCEPYEIAISSKHTHLKQVKKNWTFHGMYVQLRNSKTFHGVCKFVSQKILKILAIYHPTRQKILSTAMDSQMHADRCGCWSMCVLIGVAVDRCGCWSVLHTPNCRWWRNTGVSDQKQYLNFRTVCGHRLSGTAGLHKIVAFRVSY